jgi:hypothetical protein
VKNTPDRHPLERCSPLPGLTHALHLDPEADHAGHLVTVEVGDYQEITLHYFVLKLCIYLS